MFTAWAGVRFTRFYRAMYVVQSLVLPSYVVCPSVCPSVCIAGDWWSHRSYRSKAVAQIISLCLRSSEPLYRRSSPRETFGWNMGGDRCFSRKPAIPLKRSKIRSRILLMTNMKLHMRFRLVPKSTIFDDLE